MAINFFELLFHIDKYLYVLVNEYYSSIYFILFLIIFLETGVVATPFLPGDSLLFTVGIIAAAGGLKISMVFFIIFIAAVLGDTANYHIGKHVGPKIFRKENSILFHKEYVVRSQRFYEKHGAKTIILARFI